MNAHEEEYKDHKIEIEYDQDPQNPFEDWDWPEGLSIVHNDRNCIDILNGDLSAEEFRDMLQAEDDIELMRDYLYGAIGYEPVAKQSNNSKWYCWLWSSSAEQKREAYLKGGDEDEMSALKALAREESVPLAEDCYFLPVYKFEHSGVAYNTSGFSCPWDSGQIGYIYISKKDAVKSEWFILKEGDDLETVVHSFMEGAIETWSQFASGEVYGYIVSKKVSCSCGEHEEWEEIESCWDSTVTLSTV